MTLEKTRTLLQDQLLGGGIRAALWQNVWDVRFGAPTIAGTLPCSCVTATNQHADRRCNSCYGINFQPGYTKFGFETIWFSSISPNLTLTNVYLNDILKPNRLELTQTATHGYIVTPDIPYVRSVTNLPWEYKVDYITKSASSAVQVAWSVDQGATWQPIEQLAGFNPISGKIRFKVSLTRTNVSIPSPSFEILRARFPRVGVTGRLGPWILVLKSISPDKLSEDLRGITIDSQSNNFWTAPLSFFDCGIPDQLGVGGEFNPGNLIADQAFIEFMDGVRQGPVDQRWSLVNNTYSEPFAYMTRQYFSARLQQEREYTSLVW
jgi:hypothetical protein